MIALKVASCLGARFDVDTIDELVTKDWKTFSGGQADSPTDQIESVLWPAVEQNLLEEVAGDIFSASGAPQYKWVHDKVEESCYSLIGDASESFHLAIGRNLQGRYAKPEGETWMLILAADHLFKAKEKLSNQVEKDEVAELIFNAALELRKAAAFDSAAKFCHHTIELLGSDSWDRLYDLSLRIYNLSAEMEFCSGSQEECEEKVLQLLDKSRTLRDKYTAYWIRMENLASECYFDDAVRAGYSLLKKMKLSSLPSMITQFHVLAESFSVLRLIEKRSEDALINREEAENGDATFYIKLLVRLTIHAWFAEEPQKLVFFAMRAMRLSLKYGYTPSTSTAMAYCSFVILLFSNTKFEEARRVSKVALTLTKRWKDLEARLWTEYIYYIFIWWISNDKMGSNFDQLSQLHNTSVSSGLSSLASISGASMVWCSFYDGSCRLDRLAFHASHSIAEQIAFNKMNLLAPTRIFRQAILNLTGRSKDPLLLEGEEIKDWKGFKKEFCSDYAASRQTIIMPMILHYLFGDFREGRKLADWSIKMWKSDYPAFFAVLVPFFRCLIYCRRAEDDFGFFEFRKKRKMMLLARNDLRLVQTWDKSGSYTARSLVSFLESEWLVVNHRPDSEVKEAFDASIKKLNEAGFCHYAAMAMERVGDYFTERHEEELGISYYERAIGSYRTWGAMAKVDDIADAYPEMLNGMQHNSAESSDFSTT